MTFTSPNSLVKSLQGLIKTELSKMRSMQIMVVETLGSEDLQTGILSQYTCSVRHPIMKVRYEDVPIVGVGLGHLKGVYKFPEPGDLVLVAFLDNTPTPVVLGTLVDSFSQKPDTITPIKRNELLMTNRFEGAIVYMTNDNTTIIRTPDATGNYANGSKLKLSPDGSFKLFNKTNHGIECDAAGNITIRGTTVNFTQAGGTF